MKESKGRHQGGGRMGLARHMLVSAGLGAGFLAVLIGAAAMVSLWLDLPQGRMGLVAVPLAGLAAFVAGYFNVRPRRTQGLAFGVMAAAALYLPVLLAAVAVSRRAPGFGAVVTLLVMLLCGAVGGVVAANRTSAGHSGKPRKRV